MNNSQPAGIQLHLVTGHKHMFYQEGASLVSNICNDLDGQIFARDSLVISGKDETTAFPGRALIGITILTDPLPDSSLAREQRSKTVATQISLETFKYKRLQVQAKVEGARGVILSELEFTSGERLFLETSEIAVSAMGERGVLHNLFSRPSLTCRRLEVDFGIWNMAHIVSWSHYPKLDVPSNAWPAAAY